jgi:hypothetical protein
MSLKLLWVACASGVLATACADESSGPLAVVDEPPDAGCIRPYEPSTYDVYFVLDVSGSMDPFIMDVRRQLLAFATSFPERNNAGLRVQVSYYVTAFVNDVKDFGDGRITSTIELEAATDDAIAAGSGGRNLTQMTPDAVPPGGEHDALDALAHVLELGPSAEAKLVVLATDSLFVEAPAILYHDLHVQTAYADLLDKYMAAGIRLHAFSVPGHEGLALPFMHLPPLTSLPGSSFHDFQELAGAGDLIRQTLTSIAHGSACN